jgi:hypothetical protein
MHSSTAACVRQVLGDRRQNKIESRLIIIAVKRKSCARSVLRVISSGLAIKREIFPRR